MDDLTARIAAHTLLRLHGDWMAARDSLRRARDVEGLRGVISVRERHAAAVAEELTAALDAEEQERAALLAELRDIARGSATPGYGMRRLARLVARLEGHAVTHESPDEPAGLTPCCGKTEPRVTNEGGVLVDAPDAVTCPGEED